MDLTRDVVYRNFTLNDSEVASNVTAPSGIGRGITGCVIDTADLSDVDVVQFLEKRSAQDGMDAGDVFLGARRLRMAGTLYAVTRALLFDQIRALKSALSPTLAQRESPDDKGYLPIYYSEPTNDIENFPEGVIELRALVMPRAIQVILDRDKMGGSDSDALAVPWQATLLMKDPRIMSAEPWDHDFTVDVTADADDFLNRGNYHAPLNMLLVVGSAAGSISVTAGGSVFTITVPASTGDRTIRYNGEDKALTVEEAGVKSLRMDLLTFLNSTTHPLVPGGTSPYSITFTTSTPKTGSHMWFWESWA
ncbi:MAG TPA: hypothetical protein VFI40_04980 [Nocardioides sp.]|nr:hypothetical protein [Nocardioides sp.]